MKEEGANVFHFETGEENHLTFSDLFDINHWNHMSSKYKSSMLVILHLPGSMPLS